MCSNNCCVLVTGGAGFIGSHVVVKLLEKGNHVIVLDNLLNSKLDVIEKIRTISKSEHLIFVKGDIRDKECLEKLFYTHNIDCVMHFAALKSVSESQKFPELYQSINVDGTKTLLNIMKQYKCNNFIYSSSATVYGDSKATIYPVTENSQIGNELTCNYAKNKFEVEQYIQKLCEDKNNKIRFVVLRYFNPIGAHSSGLIGENPLGTPNNIFPYMLKVAMKSNNIITSYNNYNNYNKLTLFGSDYDTRDGTCIRDYIHVEDLAEAHIISMNYIKSNTSDASDASDASESMLRIYNVGTGKGTTVLELINIFNEVLESNNKIKITYCNGARREGDAKECYANVDKIHEELKFKTKYDVKKMCEDGLKYAKIIE